MDLTKPVVYPAGSDREFDFNSLDVVSAAGGASSGCTIKTIEVGDVQVVGYTEKAALKDGLDASDVFEGARRLTIMGELYGATRGALYENLRAMRYAVAPRLNYLESPPDRGFLPMAFSEPSDDTLTWPTGVVPLMMKLRAVSGVRTTFASRATGGTDNQPLSLPYQVTFEAKDPRIYALERIEEFISGATGAPALENRGGYPVPLNMILVAAANGTHDRIFTFVGGGTTFTVTIPMGGDPVVIRLDGYQQVVTMGQADAEVLAANLRDITDWPTLQSGTNNTLWTFKLDDGTNASLQNTSLMWYREAMG